MAHEMDTKRISEDQAKNFTGECIVVKIGSDVGTRYSIHENILCASSEFFKNAIKGQRKESSERRIDLSEEDSDVFAIYVHWMYCETLPTRIDEPGPMGYEEYLKLAKAYGLADRLQDQIFKNSVIDAFIDKNLTPTSDGDCWWPPASVIRCLYDSTHESSKGRTMLVDMYKNHANREWLIGYAGKEDFPKQFLFDLAVKLLDIASGEATRATPLIRCNYHDHYDEQRCGGAR